MSLAGTMTFVRAGGGLTSGRSRVVPGWRRRGLFPPCPQTLPHALPPPSLLWLPAGSFLVSACPCCLPQPQLMPEDTARSGRPGTGALGPGLAAASRGAPARQTLPGQRAVWRGR